MPRTYTRRSIEDRFWEKVEKGDGCWIWTGAKTRGGYGHISDESRRRRHIRAHRLSWEIHNGPVPAGLHVLHKCDNPPCVRADHLFVGTISDNWQDMYGKGRWTPPRVSGKAHRRAKLNAAQVDEIRASYAGGGVKQIDLASRYGVSKAAIWYALKGVTWRAEVI